MEDRPKVIVIGLDGATWDLIKPWADEGKLPTFKYLMENGAWGVLESTIPPMSPPAWATIVTGVKPDKHGVYDFYYIENGQLRVVSSKNIESPKIWEILDEFGHRQIIMNVPLTFPPDKVNGVFISGMPTPSLESNFTYPPELKHELLSKNYEIETDPEEGVSKVRWEMLKGDIRSVKSIVEKYNQEINNKMKILIELIKRVNPSFTFIVLTSLDRLQHYIIDYPEEILKNYVEIDNFIGSIMSLNYFDYIILISDHGFSNVKKIFYTNSFLLDKKMIKLSNRLSILRLLMMFYSIKLMKKLSKIGSPVSFLLKFKDLKNGFAYNIDTSKCYMYSHTSSGIIINADNSEEREFIKRKLISELNSLRDENGEQFLEAIPREDVYNGKYSSSIPDIILKFKKGYTTSEFLIPPFAIRKKKYLLSPAEAPAFKTGDHTPDGIVLIYGKNIKKTTIKARVEDIFPTILYLFGISIPTHIDGKVILDAFSDNFIKINKPKYSDIYTIFGIRRAIQKVKDKLKS